MCAAIACSVLRGGALWDPRDFRGGPLGRHDYDLLFDDGHVEALDVCAFTDEEAEAQREALKDRRFRETTLERCWSVGIPDRGLDLGSRSDDTFVSRLEELLAVYEAPNTVAEPPPMGIESSITITFIDARSTPASNADRLNSRT